MPTDATTERLRQFYEYQWGDHNGQVYIATLDKGSNFTQYMIEWPRHKDQIVRNTLKLNAEGKDVYFCPSLFVPQDKTVEFNDRGKTAAVRANVLGSQFLWVDFDSQSAPEDWSAKAQELGIPEPSLIIQSSVKGNQHVYWRTEFTPSPEEFEQRNRNLSIALGADRSGWDANQLLRPPFTRNYGYKGNGEHKGWYRGEPVDVIPLGEYSSGSVDPSGFDTLASAERELLASIELSGTIPTVAETLAFGNWSEDLYKQFVMTREEAEASSLDKRSGALMKLVYLAAESGMSDEQIYTILDDADKRWEKYTKRSPSSRHKVFLDTIAKARTKIGYLTGEDLTFAGLKAQAEDGEVQKLVFSFEEFLALERNIEWLVDDFLAVGGSGIITGQPGTGKTQFGLQLCIEAALGNHDILGWNNQAGPFKTLFWSLEMGIDPLKKFMASIAPAYEGRWREISKNFNVAPFGKAIPLTTKDGVAFMNNVLSEYRPDLLVIDSMQKVSTKPLTDEMASKELMEQAEELRNKYGVTIVFIHHDRKKSQDPTKVGPGGLSDMYGSQYISANVDMVLSMRKTAVKGELIVDNWKQRLAEERDSFRIKRTPYLQYVQMGEAESGDLNIEWIGQLRPGNSDTDPNEGRKGLSI